MRNCSSDGLLLYTDKPVDPEAEQRCQAETDRGDIVLTGCAVFVSIIQLSAFPQLLNEQWTKLNETMKKTDWHIFL